jgi:hypothetical protein
LLHVLPPASELPPSLPKEKDEEALIVATVVEVKGLQHFYKAPPVQAEESIDQLETRACSVFGKDFRATIRFCESTRTTSPPRQTWLVPLKSGERINASPQSVGVSLEQPTIGTLRAMFGQKRPFLAIPKIELVKLGIE